MTTIQSIQDFLGLKRLAVVGVSRDPRDFTRTLFRELQGRGYHAEDIRRSSHALFNNPWGSVQGQDHV